MDSPTRSGWYPSPNPGDTLRQRYWDGSTWTDQYRAAAQGEGPASRITPSVAWVVGTLGIFFLVTGLIRLATTHYTNSAYETGTLLGTLAIPATCLYIAWRGLRATLPSRTCVITLMSVAIGMSGDSRPSWTAVRNRWLDIVRRPKMMRR